MSRLWDLISNRQRIEPRELQEAVEEQLLSEDLDYRTRLLMRESAQILKAKNGIEIDFGSLRLPYEERLGFPRLEEKVGSITAPELILDFLRELGGRLTENAEITVGGSSALILQGLLRRQTQDVDVVDEVPAALRTLRLDSKTGLYIAHFQSHYLPEKWYDRRQSRGDIRKLRIYLVDGLDIFIGKMFSTREKDQSDLYHLRSLFERGLVRQHMRLYGRKLAGDPKLRKAADYNWFVLYDEDLPGP